MPSFPVFKGIYMLLKSGGWWPNLMSHNTQVKRAYFSLHFLTHLSPKHDTGQKKVKIVIIISDFILGTGIILT